MPLQITFDVQVDETDMQDDPWLDAYETRMMLDNTRHQLESHVKHALGDLTCPEHAKHAHVTINGVYNAETEELDVSYNVDTCCQLFLMQCIAALNRR